MLVRSDEKETSFRGFENRKVAVIQGATSGGNFKKVQPKAKIIYYEFTTSTKEFCKYI